MIYFGSYINICVNIYLIYLFVDGDEEIDPDLIVYSLVWIAMHASKMYLILYYNQLIVFQKEHINRILNNVHPHSEQMEITLRRFLLQLMANSRAHVVCNIMDLNLSVVKSLLVNASVLIIFLIQYDVTFEALNTHTNAPTPTV
ncbi:putative gustatory receptor 59f [Episyrphus balteatus]|uniref:putative gustatory receptor 59f n=1 Tax=Episyrphus balteatus TaxID=286459 RepID=UPI0024867BCF|nr:putative gustatory receptor 59f [Episyrphus balteatus]